MKTGDWSKYSEYSFSRQRSKKRATSLHGIGEDRNRFYRCSNCGYIVDSNQSALGSASSHNELPYTDSTIENPNRAVSGDILNVTPILGTLTNWFVALQLGANGTAKTIVHDFEDVFSGGCPFCGSLDWK